MSHYIIKSLSASLLLLNLVAGAAEPKKEGHGAAASAAAAALASVRAESPKRAMTPRAVAALSIFAAAAGTAPLDEMKKRAESPKLPMSPRSIRNAQIDTLRKQMAENMMSTQEAVSSVTHPSYTQRTILLEERMMQGFEIHLDSQRKLDKLEGVYTRKFEFCGDDETTYSNLIQQRFRRTIIGAIFAQDGFQTGDHMTQAAREAGF